MIYDALFYFALAAEALIAAPTSVRTRPDWVGGVLLSMLVPLGGGTLRDLMLGRTPVMWVAHPSYLWTCIGGALVGLSMIVRLQRHVRTVLIVETFGLIFFSAAGARKALDLGFGPTLCIVSAGVTATFGSVLRDMACRRLPELLSNKLDLTASLATGTLYTLLRELGTDDMSALGMAIACGMVFRSVALRQRWHFPQLLPPHDRKRRPISATLAGRKRA